MKKILCSLMVCMFMFGMVFTSAYASGGEKDVSDIPLYEEYSAEYPYIYYIKSGYGSYVFTPEPLYWDTTRSCLSAGSDFNYVKFTGSGADVEIKSASSGYYIMYRPSWTNADIYDENGSLFYIADKLTGVVTKFNDFKEVITTAGEQFSVNTAVEVLAFIAVSVVALPFMWWGARKLVRATMTAFRKGRVKV